MQRLTKYALLLKAILKKTEDEEQQDTLKAMVSIVLEPVYRLDVNRPSSYYS